MHLYILPIHMPYIQVHTHVDTHAGTRAYTCLYTCLQTCLHTSLHTCPYTLSRHMFTHVSMQRFRSVPRHTCPDACTSMHTHQRVLRAWRAGRRGSPLETASPRLGITMRMHMHMDISMCRRVHIHMHIHVHRHACMLGHVPREPACVLAHAHMHARTLARTHFSRGSGSRRARCP